VKASYIKHLLPRILLVILWFGASEKGWGQTPNGTLDFGTTANGTTATTGNTGFGGVRVGSGGGGFTIQNPGQSIGSDGELRGIAPTGTSINSVGITSTEYGTAATTFTISFELHLSGGSSGTWYFFAGNGASFSSAQSSGFTGDQVFTGIQWEFGASSAITTKNRAVSSWNATGLSTPFAQSTSYYVTIIGNNSSSTVNYGASSAYSIAAYKYDLWVNGSLAGNDLAKAELANSTNINAFRFYGISSTGNVATIALDNIRWYNTCVLPPTHLALVSVPTTGTVGTNLTSFTTEARSGSSSGPVANSFTGAITVAKVSGAGSISGTTAPNAVAGVATYSNIQFSSADVYTIKATAAAPIVDAATSANIMVSSATPSITLSSANPAVAAADLIPSATKQPIYKFTAAVTTATATLNSVAFTTANSSASDITKYQLWYKSSDDLSTATQIGTDITASLGSGSHTFSSLTQAISSGATGYFWITVDVASAPTASNTLSVSAITTSDLTFASGTKSGTASAGGTQTFINTPGAPTLGTITPANEQLSVSFTAPSSTGGSAITNYKYSTNGGSSYTAVSPAATTSPITITSLTNGTSYSVKIRAVNAAGDGTESNASSGTPRTTPGAPNINTITPGNQQLEVTFTAPGSNGGSAITDYEYSTDNGSTFKSSGVTSSPYTITTQSGSSSALVNGTQYSIIFRAVNIAGSGTSSTMVTGTPASGCTAPSTQATGFGTSSVTDVAATISWTRGNGDNVLVLLKSGSAVNSSPSSGTSYSANATFGSGSQLGTGNYVVYAGSGTSVAVTGLTTGVTYHVAVIEYANSGTCYSTGPLTGNFTTKSLPAVSTSAASGVGLTTATLNGNVTNDGGYSVSRGFVYSSINTAPTVGGANVTDVSVGTGTGTYTNSPTLAQNTLYYYQAYASNTMGTVYGGVQNFTTLKPEPTAHVTSFALGTITTSNIPVTWTAASPQPDGYLLLVNSSSVTDPTDGTAVADDLDVSNGTGAVNLGGSESSYNSFTGFAAGTTYTFKIYPYNNSGSSIDYLVTSAPSVNSVLLPAAPSTPTFSLVTQSSFTITWGSVTGAGSYRLDLSANSGFSSYISGYQDLTVNSTSQAVSGLSANTTYYARVRAVNSAGTSTNASANQATLCTPTDVTSLAGTNGNAQSEVTFALPACYDEVLVVAKPTSSVSAAPSGDGSAYTANATFGSGTTFNTSGSVVYKGAGTSVTVTGLTNGTTYYIKAFTREGSQWSSGTEVSVVPTIPVTLWANISASTAWYTSGNWNPSTLSSAWLSTDVAQFQNSGSATTAGINMGTAALSIGGIEIHATRTRALTIGNSSTTSGTLTLNGTLINLISNVILRNNSSSLLTLQNNEVGSNKTMNIAIANSTNNIIFIDSSGGITISSVISGASKNLSLSGSGSGKLRLSGSNTYSGGFTLNSGRKLEIDNDNALGTGTFTINGGVIDAINSPRSITNSMSIASSFRFTGTQNLTQGTGNITLTASPTIIVDANILTLGGIISGSYGLTKAGSGTLTMTAGNTYSGLTQVSAGTLILNKSGGTTIPATNNVTVSGGTLRISSNQTLNDVTLSSGTLQVDAGVTLTINGAYTGGGTIVNNGKIVITASSAFPGSSTTISAINDLEINRSGGVALNKDMTISGTLTLTSGILDISSQTLTISGSVARTSGTLDADAGTLTFTNTTGQTLPSSLFTGNINNLTLNGSGGVVFGNAASVTGALTLTSGVLTTTSTNLLSLADGASVSGASNSSFVHGPIKKIGNTGFTFPVGASGTGYQPIQIANFAGTTASTDAFTAEYKRSSAAGVGSNINSPVNRVSFCEYWQLDRTTGTPAVDVTLHFNTNSGCGGGTPADYLTGSGGLLSELRVCRWDGTQWVNYTTSYTGTAPNVTLTATGVSSFSPFTVGSTGMAPLPLKLLSFKGVKREGAVHLNWVTLDETHMKSVVLQSSADGINIERVAELQARNTPVNTYSFIDSTAGMRKMYRMQQNRYYRLEFIEQDLSSEFSPWINVIDSELYNYNSKFDVYPNPSDGKGFYISSFNPSKILATIRISDNAGRTMLQQETMLENSTLISTKMLKPGLYNLTIISADGIVENHKISIQP